MSGGSDGFDVDIAPLLIKESVETPLIYLDEKALERAAKDLGVAVKVRTLLTMPKLMNPSVSWGKYRPTLCYGLARLAKRILRSDGQEVPETSNGRKPNPPHYMYLAGEDWYDTRRHSWFLKRF